MIKSDFIEVKGGQIFAQLSTPSEVDFSPTVVLINGMGRSSTDFKFLSKKILAAKFKVLTFDNRGVGESTNVLPKFTMEDLAEDLNLVLEHFNLKTVNIVGLSMGGMIAQTFAIKYPEKVKSLTLVSTSPASHYLSGQRPTSLRFPAEIYEIFSHYVSPDFYKQNKALCETIAKMLAKNLENPAFAKIMSLQQDAIAKMPNLHEELKKLTLPVLLIHGALDEMISPEAFEDLKNSFCQVQSHLYPNSGHLLLIEAGQQLLDDLLEFLLLEKL